MVKLVKKEVANRLLNIGTCLKSVGQRRRGRVLSEVDSQFLFVGFGHEVIGFNLFNVGCLKLQKRSLNIGIGLESLCQVGGANFMCTCYERNKSNDRGRLGKNTKVLVKKIIVYNCKWCCDDTLHG